MAELTDPAAAVEAFDCPMCEASAGSACRTRDGKVAPKYHTPRFMLVPQLRAELEVRTPALRGVGRPWRAGPAIEAVPPVSARPTRVGYARCSTAQQERQSQLDALTEAGCEPIFSEKISTRVRARPEFPRAMEYARTIKQAVPHQRVIFTVHEMKRLSRGAAELLTIAEDLRHHDIELELLTGPLQGIYNPSGHGAALFAFFSGMAESEREYIREKFLEGQASARERGRHGGRPKVLDEDMIVYARSLRERGVAVPDIARKLVIPSGKNKGEHPSIASVYRGARRWGEPGSARREQPWARGRCWVRQPVR
ncbi:recombinase family protein [Nonomuraea sp. NN258]|uniref:recombinase family protein n=1 Tax=Nonomuraea antri TaxID=2730852 RepID=UPI00156964DB|nr:recombinase family protein [Nonomuraea antri]NRQ39573.1 recombinase family protein [Nonomuraea antri]